MKVYIPNPGDKLSEDIAWQWYSNVLTEFAKGTLGQTERIHMISNKTSESVLLKNWKRPFFRNHYAKTFTEALSFLFAVPTKRPVILDLGCGTGTQSLAFALLGAKVISLDMNKLSLEILHERKIFYEKQSGRILDIQICNADVFTFNYASIAPIDGIYSLFAFNMMQPSKKLISLIAPYMSKEGKIALLDGNRSCWESRLFPWRRRRVLSPIELEEDLGKHGFATVDHYGGVVFPPGLWCCLPYSLLSRLDRWLGSRSWLFPVSHQILARRR